jgi:hypothetical protein
MRKLLLALSLVVAAVLLAGATPKTIRAVAITRDAGSEWRDAGASSSRSGSGACHGDHETYPDGEGHCCRGFTPVPTPKGRICLPDPPAGVEY